jgi:proton-dependent oligopeptide transporter, POT family
VAIPIPESNGGVRFAVKVRGVARKNAITGELGDALQSFLNLATVEGRAHEASNLGEPFEAAALFRYHCLRPDQKRKTDSSLPTLGRASQAAHGSADAGKTERRDRGRGRPRRAVITEPLLSFSERFEEIRTGFERPFWVANISEIFERLSYYGAFASLALYLQERLNFSTEQTGTLTGIFGGMVWFLAIFGGAAADRLGFRRALSMAYLILAVAYFLIGSIAAPWLAPVRNAMPLSLFVGIILLLPALGISLVKPCVVGTTARASKENVRSIGYSIYYTMVNIGGAAGPLFASWAHRHLGVENVYRVAALSVLAMFFFVLIFFREPHKPGDAPPPSIAIVARNFCVVLGNYRLVLPALAITLLLRIAVMIYPVTVPWWIWIGLLAVALAGISRFMWFLVLFTGYWIVFWQQYISLPGYIHGYINPHADVEKILVTDGLTVIGLTLAVNFLTRRIPAFQAVILGTVITSVSWLILAFRPTIWGVVLSLFVLALGEIIQSPRYYEYISRLAPPGQQGTYMGFAFLPIGIGALIGGWFGGTLMHRLGEIAHQPERIWWVVTGVGVATAMLLWIYDRMISRTRVPAADVGDKSPVE